MGKEFYLRKFYSAEDIAKYFYEYYDPVSLYRAFPTKGESEILLQLLDGHGYALVYDVKNGQIYREDYSSIPESDMEISETYSFELAVRFCLDMALELLEEKEGSGEEGMLESAKALSGWLHRIEQAKACGKVCI